MFTIGEFSRITGLTVKTLRFYHEQGVLSPSFVDPQTGYRYYDQRQVAAASAVAYLRGLELSIADVKEILACETEPQIAAVLRRHRPVLRERVKRLNEALRSLDQIIREEQETRAMTKPAYEVEEKTLAPTLVAAIRMRGRYDACGEAFAKIARAMGRHLCGKAMLLHYDAEYREDDADFEACMPVRPAAAAGGKSADGLEVRKLPAVRCITLVHRGSYEQLGRSYAIVLKDVRQRGLRIVMPTREVYLKGPGMFLRGNPKNYITEIQIPVEAEGATT